MSWHKFRAQIVRGVPQWFTKAEKARVMTALEGTTVDIWIRAAAKPQGTQTMRYYRGVVIPDIARACGYTDPDDFDRVHQSLAWKFLRMADDPLGFPRRQSTAKHKMDQEQMSAYVNQVIDHAESSIPGCRVRRPNEVEDWDAVYEHPFDDEEAA